MDTLKGHLYGVDIHDPFGIGNTYDLFIWEPNVIKKNALAAATEVIILYLL
jgi:chaperonin GroEL (HSP60 family)